MSTNIMKWCLCDECQGSGLVFTLLRGSGTLVQQRCAPCLGFGEVSRPMTKHEKRVLGQRLLDESAT